MILIKFNDLIYVWFTWNPKMNVKFNNTEVYTHMTLLFCLPRAYFTSAKLAQRWGLLNQFPPFRYFPELFTIAKTRVTYRIARPHFTGIDTAHVRWHPSNMKVFQVFCKNKYFLNGKINEWRFPNPTPEIEARVNNTMP